MNLHWIKWGFRHSVISGIACVNLDIVVVTVVAKNALACMVLSYLNGSIATSLHDEIYWDARDVALVCISRK